MKTGSLLLLFLLMLASLLGSGCTLTPHASIGVDLTMSNGKLKLRPDAHIGVYGSP